MPAKQPRIAAYVKRNFAKLPRNPCTISTRRSLHDARVVCDTFNPREGSPAQQAAHGTAEHSRTNKIQEQWMKLAKTSVIAFALSAVLVGPALAQGAATGGTIRGGAQERGAAPGGMTGGTDEEMNAQTETQTGKAGAKSGAKGTVGAGGSARKGTATEPAPGSKRY
ncbi:hypothetical protein [Bradyrhizobium sp. BRP22]|uniref:hypothetical protein n=1 Tax=Bradyrhizobium sp. BRP22 TaxID=2793821 RepID=UPI001CD33592|nr:hypothetical protein [Bradyrhizobium sp. BRP22]